MKLGGLATTRQATFAIIDKCFPEGPHTSHHSFQNTVRATLLVSPCIKKHTF